MGKKFLWIVGIIITIVLIVTGFWMVVLQWVIMIGFVAAVIIFAIAKLRSSFKDGGVGGVANDMKDKFMERAGEEKAKAEKEIERLKKEKEKNK